MKRGCFPCDVVATSPPLAPEAPSRAFGVDDELERVVVAVGWAVRVADHGTAGERAELSNLIDRLMEAETRRDLATLQSAGRRLAALAWTIGQQVRGASGEAEDQAERAALQAVERAAG